MTLRLEEAAEEETVRIQENMVDVVEKENVNVVNVSVTIQMNGLDYFARFQIVQIVFVQLVKHFQDRFQTESVGSLSSIV